MLYRVRVSYSDEFTFKSGETALRVAELLLMNGDRDELEIKLIREKEDNDDTDDTDDTDEVTDVEADDHIEGWCVDND